MCLLAYFAPQASINWHGLQQACENNPDGFGWALHLGSTIKVGRSMDATTALNTFYDALAEHPNAPAMFHARYATHGSENLANVHPFWVGGDEGEQTTVFAHNGILPVDIPKGDWRSDTRYFAEEILPYRSRKLWDKRNKLRKLESWMGGSKFVVFTTDTNLAQPVYIVNEDLGHWVGKPGEGTWWSNNSYKESYYRLCSWSSPGGRVYTDDEVAAVMAEARDANPDRYCPGCSIWLTDRERLQDRFCSTCSMCLDCESTGPDCLCYMPEHIQRKRMDIHSEFAFGMSHTHNEDLPEWALRDDDDDEAYGPTDAELEALRREAIIAHAGRTAHDRATALRYIDDEAISRTPEFTAPALSWELG